jgi:hypothetical protein
MKASPPSNIASAEVQENVKEGFNQAENHVVPPEKMLHMKMAGWTVETARPTTSGLKT